MILVGTNLLVADNSGAKEVCCIRILRKKKKAFVGDIIVVSVKKSVSSSIAKQGEVFLAIIVRTKRRIKRKNGFCIQFSDNSVVLLNRQKEPLGNRVLGAIPSEVKDFGYTKIISLAKEIV